MFKVSENRPKDMSVKITKILKMAITKNKIFDSNNTTISYTDSEISNNSIQDIQIDHKIKKFNLNFTNQSTKNNVFIIYYVHL